MASKPNSYQRLREHLDLTHGEIAASIHITRARWTQCEGGHGYLGAGAVLALQKKYHRPMRKLDLVAEDFCRPRKVKP